MFKIFIQIVFITQIVFGFTIDNLKKKTEDEIIISDVPDDTLEEVSIAISITSILNY